MQKLNIIADKSLPAFLLLFLSSLLMMTGCGGSKIKMPQPMPPAVKEYRNVKLYGGHAGMKETGIYLRYGDMYSIFASGANEVSAEDDRLQHGIFTYYLLKGLKGPADADNDGLVSVDEAYRYVTNQVPRATGQEQHPVKKGTVEGSLILSIIP
jgi:hypothetical protein